MWSWEGKLQEGREETGGMKNVRFYRNRGRGTGGMAADKNNIT